MVEKIRNIINRREVRESWQGLTKTDRVNVNETERLVSLIAGAGLVGYGLTRCSLNGLGWACAGGYLVYRGLSGHCPAYETAHISTANRAERLQFRAGNQARYQPHQQKRVESTIRNDSVVDEVALESFPASDPPAWTVSRG